MKFLGFFGTLGAYGLTGANNPILSSLHVTEVVADIVLRGLQRSGLSVAPSCGFSD